MSKYIGPLLWKSWCIRKRHYIYTILELGLPIACYLLLIYMKINASNNNTGPEKEQIFVPSNKQELFLQPSNHGHNKIVIAYTPQNNETITSIMGNVVKSLSNEYVVVQIPSSDEKALMKTLFDEYGNNTSSLLTMVFGLVFHTSKPNYEYTLRPLTQSIPTTTVFPPFSSPGPGLEYYYYSNSGFLLLQMAINDAIHAKVNPSSSSQVNFDMTEFPYPSYYKEDGFKLLFTMAIPTLTMFGYYVIIPNLISNAIQEKNSGSREWMSMVGIPRIMILFSWVLHSMFFYFFTSVINSIVLVSISVGGSPILNSTNFFWIWLLLFLFCTNTVFFLLAFTSFINNPNVGITVGSLLFILPSVIVSNYQNTTNISLTAKLLTSFFPSVTLNWAFVSISGYEANHDVVTFSNLFTMQKGQSTTIPLGITYVIFIITTVLYCFVFVYIDSVKPGNFGRARPWYFPLMKLKRFFSNKNTNDEMPEHFNSKSAFEEVTNLPIGLRVLGIKKIFRNVVAIEDVTIDIYKGQITALLGHNGAGKTTLINIITGMFSPTNGKILKDNKNVFDNFQSFQKNLGLCPQHDLLFPYLNVVEHVMFFGMLRGMSRKDAIRGARALLEFFGIANKASCLTKKLSGGMKRKLSLAISLIGDPEILILDEPTSGMDPESRRETWNKLLALRGERTIILTTHYMEEADVLGDKIAIMDHGVIKCYGTSLFLKRHYGSGYKITVPHEYQKTTEEIVKSYVPSASSVVSDSTVSYDLPLEKSGSFGELFQAIETHIPDSSFSVACTTLDDVFLKVAHSGIDEVDKMASDEELLLNDSCRGDDVHSSSEALTPKALSGLSLFLRRLYGLFMKKMLYNYHRWASWFFQTILYPFVILLIPLLLSSTILNAQLTDPSLAMELDIYGDTEVVFAPSHGPDHKLSDSFTSLVKNDGSRISLMQPNSSDLAHALLQAGTDNLSKYRLYYIVAADFSAKVVNMFFSSIGTHSMPIALNLFYNSLFSNSEIKTKVLTYNHPLNFQRDVCSNWMAFSTIPSFIWIFTVPTVLGVICYSFSRLHHEERLSSGKLLQLMTGTSPALYWFSAFLCDFILFSFSCLLILLYVYIFDTAHLFDSLRDYGLLLFVLIMSCIGNTWFGYLTSYFLRTFSRLFSTNVFLTLIFGQVAYFVVILLKLVSGTEGVSEAYYTSSQNSTITGIDVAHHVLMLYPSYCSTALIYKLIKYLTTNVLKKKCFKVDLPSTEESIFKWDNTGINQELIYVSCDWIIFAIIIFLIDYQVFNKTRSYISHLMYGDIYVSEDNADSDVKAEKNRVHQARSNLQGVHSRIIVSELGKKYSKKVAAVKNISFLVQKGECFGLLGVNGAGKSTTFKMLTGDLLPSAGEAIIFGDSLCSDILKYQSHIGYCPQTDAIIDALTGTELLTLYAHLRGVNPSVLNRTVSFWINEFGMQNVCNRRSETYSGGNKRKLSTAISLIGDPQVIFLDEPTTGVDPVARRKFWSILAKLQKKGCTIILTSHSMDECEVVCDRLTIMVEGEMKCVGNIQRLKELYGQGYTVVMQLNENLSDKLQNLKTSFCDEFSPHAILRDEHIGLLHYHIKSPTYRWSRLFSIMENMKHQHAIIKEYVIMETTLEQIFLHFAKK